MQCEMNLFLNFPCHLILKFMRKKFLILKCKEYVKKKPHEELSPVFIY